MPPLLAMSSSSPLQLVVAGAFYPNYFHWGESDEELNQKAMSGHDPATTVMVSGYDMIYLIID